MLDLTDLMILCQTNDNLGFTCVSLTVQILFSNDLSQCMDEGILLEYWISSNTSHIYFYKDSDVPSLVEPDLVGNLVLGSGEVSKAGFMEGVRY